VSSWESLLLNAAVPSHLHRSEHLGFLMCDLVLSRMQAHAGSVSQADSCPPMVSPFSSESLSPSCSQCLFTKASCVDCIPNLIRSGQCSNVDPDAAWHQNKIAFLPPVLLAESMLRFDWLNCKQRRKGSLSSLSGYQSTVFLGHAVSDLRKRTHASSGKKAKCRRKHCKNKF